jgi:hypothetical protein
MPPQQPDRPLDILDDGFDFRAHEIDSANIVLRRHAARAARM